MLYNGRMRGMLISFEGGEGAGKSTQIELLRLKLSRMGKEVVVCREPGGTEISEQIREVVLSHKNTGMAVMTEVLLFQAARAQIYQEIVLPALALEKVVVMDRTRDSSVVYQGVVRKVGVEVIERLNDISTQSAKPDLTILLDVPSEVGLKRRGESGEVNRIDKEEVEFHQAVRQGYLDLAKKEPKRWVVVDAGKPVDEVAEKVWEAVKGLWFKKIHG